VTRIQALALVIRLMGLEEKAEGHAGGNPFKDVPEWGAGYAGLAYEMGLAAGVDEQHTLFAPDRLSTPQEFCAFLLRALQYFERDNDFAFAESVRKAADVGILPESGLGSNG
jgi:hypothetical protein